MNPYTLTDEFGTVITVYPDKFSLPRIKIEAPNGITAEFRGKEIDAQSLVDALNQYIPVPPPAT